ncbi:XAP-5-like protein [Euroglyphus maynei]|uniref:Protein FAM50 homolog n=1 Tax=Euroglyphus maynei TaxID=6958 RepID=A0A1Y3B085_EURMA|nr:XAP-5-like protein [Euroglyphus maynei]
MTHYKGAASEGGRALQLQKKREKALEELELRKKKIEDELKLSNIGNKFAAHYDAIEQQIKSSTVGLVTLGEMRAKQEGLEPQKKKRKMMKNPDVDTSFLPDRAREEEENRLREQLRQEWAEKQEKLKNEEIEITFSYWDGSGHRRSVMMKKGNTMYQFLQKALELLRKEFHELKTVTTDQLMYIKEDLIIPHHYSFYDFIVTKARGKSGPLFSFDVHEDVRLVSDATVERDESHAGKVLLRSWYERNKHIFPASRWEPYDPNKNYDKYTIGDRVKK